MDDIFRKNQSILIAGTTINGKTEDIFIDETGTIAAIGENVRKQHKGEADLEIGRAHV